eukprot:1162584-Pleurochrysis_carterae.AAC.3
MCTPSVDRWRDLQSEHDMAIPVQSRGLKTRRLNCEICSVSEQRRNILFAAVRREPLEPRFHANGLAYAANVASV